MKYTFLKVNKSHVHFYLLCFSVQLNVCHSGVSRESKKKLGEKQVLKRTEQILARSRVFKLEKQAHLCLYIDMCILYKCGQCNFFFFFRLAATECALFILMKYLFNHLVIGFYNFFFFIVLFSSYHCVYICMLE